MVTNKCKSPRHQYLCVDLYDDLFDLRTKTTLTLQGTEVRIGLTF